MLQNTCEEHFQLGSVVVLIVDLKQFQTCKTRSGRFYGGIAIYFIAKFQRTNLVFSCKITIYNSIIYLNKSSF